MCGKKSSAPAPLPVAVPDPTIARRGTTDGSGVTAARRVAGTAEDGITGGLGGSASATAPVSKSVLGG